MKVKTISRRTSDYTRDSSQSLRVIHKNADPVLHPQSRRVEYQRALNSTKIDRMKAKPFVASMDGHLDTVFTMASNPRRINTLITGSCDGNIKVWNLPSRSTVLDLDAHRGFVRGVSVSPTGDRLLSCGDDQTIRLWGLPRGTSGHESSTNNLEALKSPLVEYTVEGHLSGIDYHPTSEMFACSGSTMTVWDANRDTPTHTFEWGSDTILSTRWNRVERHLLASTAADRSVVIYDVRAATAVTKVTMNMRINQMAWNPRVAGDFAAASDDNHVYTFDMRNLEKARTVHKGHVGAVMDVDYSPTGKEFVTGGFDKMVRIWKVDSQFSREVYHTKRMQRIFCVRYSQDSRYVFTGSDDANLRIWKSVASAGMAPLANRAKFDLQYKDALRKKYAHVPEIARIAKQRQLPKAIHTSLKKVAEMHKAQNKKQRNFEIHGGGEKLAPEQKRWIRKTE